MTDRRAYFFLGTAVAVAATYPLIPNEFRWASAAVAAIYLALAALFAAANLSANRIARKNGHH
ncbi:MAG: hypothetical protein ACT4OP_03300 [Actinomycetota bacterium]